MATRVRITCLLFFLTLFAIGKLEGQRQKVGVVLSGGGAAALSHVGFLKALEEEDVPIDYITGTSMGAFIGAMYASGHSPETIDSIVRSYEFQQMAKGKVPERYGYFFKKPEETASLVTLKFFKDSLIQTSLPTNLIDPLMMDLALMEEFSAPAAKAGYDFDSLFIPFRCLAADIEAKERVIFKDGDLNQAVRASMSYPFYLRPIEVNGRLLFDGGLYNNFPTDVMDQSFDPDIIIGNNVSDNVPSPREGDIISQVKNMLIDRTDYSELSSEHIVIEPDDGTSTFDFSDIPESIQNGYDATKEKMDTIRELVQHRAKADSLEKARKRFRKGLSELRFDEIKVQGLDKVQSRYVKRILNVKKYPIEMEDLRPKYFRVYSDNKIKHVFPTAKYLEESGHYSLNLEVEREKDIFVDFGGNISSRPINMGYVGLQYNHLGQLPFSLNLNSYFGKFYGSVQARGRVDFSLHPSFYLEPLVTFNRWDYFKSSTAFFEDVRPSFLVQEERYAGLRGGLPIGNKGKFMLDGKYATIRNEYYQADQFSSTDTADQTRFDNWTVGMSWERSTLNRKQYSTKGSHLSLKARWVDGKELTIPGSTAESNDTTEAYHQWPQFKISYQNYFKRKGWWRVGFSLEGVYSDQPFFDNYSGTILSAPAYQPIPESKTLFLHGFRAYKYLGGGIQNVFKIADNLDLRLEGYAFQPYRAIIRRADLNARFGAVFAHRNFLGSGSLVYHSPIGPVSLALNYYDEREEPWSLLFNFGYLIFNDRPLD